MRYELRDDELSYYAFIAEGFREIFLDAWMVVSSFDAATRLFTCRAFAGTDEDCRVFDEELGSSPVGFRFSIDGIPSAESVFSCPSVMEAPSSFQHMSFWTVPGEVCDRIDRRLTVGRAYTMSFLCRGTLRRRHL
ncbi:MAG: hypothetical protein GXY82_10635 [Methanospirillum sp.]|nr:hypothetical protein [Methanospirillum sp.]